MDTMRARRIMEKHGLDVLIGTARENIAYVTGLEGLDRRGSNRLERMYVVFPRDPSKETVLVIPQGSLLWLVQNKHVPVAIRTIGTYYYVMADEDNLTAEERALVALRNETPGHASSIEALLAAVSDMALPQHAIIGIDETQITYGEVDQVRRAWPKAQVCESYGVFREIRMIKTPAEIERLRRAAQVNQKAMLDAIDLIRPGVEHRVVQAKLRAGMLNAGATISHDACGFSWRSSYSHTEPSTYQAQAGDLFKFDVGLYLNGYAADTARTGVVGQPSREQQHHYEVLREAQQLAIANLRPGVLASDLYHMMQEVMRKGLRNPTFVRSNYGHGIGKDVYDPPTIAATDHTPLEAGMVLNIEAPDHELGFGGLTLEDTLLLHEDGVEYFTDADRNLYIR